MIEPNRNHYRTVGAGTPPPLSAPAPSAGASVDSFSELAAKIARAKVETTAALEDLRHPGILNECKVSALHQLVSTTLPEIEGTRSLLKPVVLSAIIFTTSVINAFSYFAEHPELTAFYAGVAVVIGSISGLAIRSRQRAISPERIAQRGLDSINENSEQLRSACMYNFGALGFQLEQSCSGKMYLTEEGRDAATGGMKGFRLICGVVKMNAAEIPETAEAEKDVTVQIGKRYLGLYHKFGDALESYLTERDNLLKSDAPPFRHLELNETGEELVRLFRDLLKGMPRYRFNMPDDPRLNDSNYTKPSIWAVITCKVPKWTG